MPCWEISRQTVNLSAAHTGYLTAAINLSPEFADVVTRGNTMYGRHTATRASFEVNLTDKTVSVEGRASSRAGTVANAINRAYATHVTKTVLKRNGFSIENVTDGGHKFEIAV